MQIAVVGTGYVGLVVGACLADTGNDVVCADVDATKIAGLARTDGGGNPAPVLPIFEPGLAELVERNRRERRLAFTTDIAGAVARASVVFIAVGTPAGEDGSADLSHVLAVAETVGRAMTQETVVVTKSTVPVGTAGLVAETISRYSSVPFHVCSNPEFLKEGAAVDDFLHPDRVVLGVETDHARSALAQLYAPFVRTGNPIIFMDIVSAELTKYAANAMLATRITLMNEIAYLSERLGANIDHVRRGIGTDARIGSAFLFPGPGYGGSCFPKDVKALARAAEQCKAPLGVLAAVHDANARQQRRMFEKVNWALGGDLRGASIAVWGLSFKAQTDDIRESPAICLIEELIENGARVVAHDPAAIANAERHFAARASGAVRFAPTSYDALIGADALVIATEWNEYRHPNFDRVREALARPLIVDGRNLYDPMVMRQRGFTYLSIGRPPVIADDRQSAVRAPAFPPRVIEEAQCAS